MKYLHTALLWVVVIAPGAAAEGAKDQNPNGLSIVIVPTKVEAGTSIIERHGTFRVIFTNNSTKPIRLWSEYCELGYETLSFRVEEDGQSSLMYKRSRHASSWEDKPPQVTTIRPGSTFSWKIYPSGIWGEWEWKGALEPNTGKATRLTAIFEIKPTDAAKKHGVWTGRVTSKPVEALVVDPKLRTPHEYLWAQCPKQALRIMQAEREWVNKKDKDDQTPLHLAVRCEFHDVARWLLSHGADVNGQSYNRFTPLHVAREPEMLKLLIKHKADLEAKDSSGRTALENAASYCTDREHVADLHWRKIVKTLLDAGAYYDIRSAIYLNDLKRVRAILMEDKNVARNDHQGHLLCQAGRYGREQIVKALLEHKADANAKREGGNFMTTPLVEGIRYPAIVKMLLDAGADAKVRPWGRFVENPTVLHLAAEAGAIESAKHVLGWGLLVHDRDDNGATPLHYAVAHRQMVEFLLSRGADVNAATDDGYTTLHYAAGQPEVVKLLLAKGAKATAVTKDGWTPMALAATQMRVPIAKYEKVNARRRAVIEILHAHGVPLDLLAAIALDSREGVAKLLKDDPSLANGKVRMAMSRGGLDQTHEPALHWTVNLNRKEIVALLLDRGAKINITDVNGYTALHTAASWGWEEITRLLIKRKIDVNLAAKDGWTPLHDAVRLQTTGVAKLLLEAGAKVDAKDANGQTPLALAEEAEEEEMIQLLRKYQDKK